MNFFWCAVQCAKKHCPQTPASHSSCCPLSPGPLAPHTISDTQTTSRRPSSCHPGRRAVHICPPSFCTTMPHTALCCTACLHAVGGCCGLHRDCFNLVNVSVNDRGQALCMQQPSYQAALKQGIQAADLGSREWYAAARASIDQAATDWQQQNAECDWQRRVLGCTCHSWCVTSCELSISACCLLQAARGYATVRGVSTHLGTCPGCCRVPSHDSSCKRMAEAVSGSSQ